MAELRRQLTVLARSPLPLLIEGETGTGKSFLAKRVIHPLSGAKGPLVTTDLSTVPPALLPAHLFGARRGAFTGATEDQVGVFEQAHGGTLFLDEIANLDLDLQRQLLLVLERGTVSRLGETRARPAAANWTPISRPPPNSMSCLSRVPSKASRRSSRFRKAAINSAPSASSRIPGAPNIRARLVRS